MQRRPRSKFRVLQSIPLAAPIMRSVMPPQRNVVIIPTLRKVALAPQIIICKLMRGAEPIRRERDGALTGTAQLICWAGITTACNGGREAQFASMASAARGPDNAQRYTCLAKSVGIQVAAPSRARTAKATLGDYSGIDQAGERDSGLSATAQLES